MKNALIITISTLALCACHAGALKAEEAPKKLGCYVEASGVGHTNQTPGAGNTIEQTGLGIGCEHDKNGLMVGGGVRLDMGSSQRQGTVYGTAGVSLNATDTKAYGIAGYNFDASSGVNAINIQKGGVVIVGGGVEQKITSDVSGFIEVTKDLMQVGAARGLDPQYTARVGARVKF